MTEQRNASIIFILEAATLAAFFTFVQIGDSFLPETGGNGEGNSIALWNNLATGAISCLFLLWAAAVINALRPKIQGGTSLWTAMLESFEGASALAVGFPFVGLAIGYMAHLSL